MSAVASFIKPPKSALVGFRQSAVPKKRFLRPPLDTFYDFLRQHGSEVGEFDGSGYVFATLPPYLDEEHAIQLMDCEYAELVSEARGATHFIFTAAHKDAYLAKLAGPFSEQSARDYYNKSV
jgi:hypothetical protein